MLDLSQKNFKIALLISFICHSVIFFPFDQFFLNIEDIHTKNIEVTYYSSHPEDFKKYTSIPRKSVELKDAVKQSLSEELKQEKLKNESMPENSTTSKESTLVKKSSVEPVIDRKMKKMRTYISYYQVLRAKIKQHVNYPKSLSDGQVYLNFTLTKDGKLKMIKINEEHSTTDVLLRTAALESIQKATPFPPFPDDFHQNEATFNVVISFQIR